MAGQELQIQQLWVVAGCHLKNPVLLQDSKIEWVDNAVTQKPDMFYRLAKKDSDVNRLLFGVSRGQYSVANTTIIEKLMECRDAARDATIEGLRVAEAEEASSKLEGRISINFDNDVATPAPYTKTLPQRYVSFSSPSTDTIASVSITAIIEPSPKKSNPRTLHIKLTGEVLLYLHEFAMHEATMGVHNVRPGGKSKIGNQVQRITSGRYAGQYRLRKPGLPQVIFEADSEQEAAIMGLKLAAEQTSTDDGHPQLKRGREYATEDSEEAVTDDDDMMIDSQITDTNTESQSVDARIDSQSVDVQTNSQHSVAMPDAE